MDKMWYDTYTRTLYNREHDLDTMTRVWESLLDQHEPFKQKEKTKRRPELKVVDF